MSFFYDLNKRLANLGTEAKQIAESVEKAKAEVKSPARITLEESLKQDMKALMEDGTGGMNFSGSGSMEEAGYSAKKAAAGKDIGKKGKNFAKIAKSAGKEYGSKEAGERVAGAVLNKLRNAKEAVEEAGYELAADDIDAASKKDFKGIKKAVIKHRHDKELDEAGLPDIVDKKAKMDIAKGKKPSSMRNVMKGLRAFVKGTAEPLDEMNEDAEIIKFLKAKAGPQGAAHPTPYNKSKGADAYNGMWGTGMDQDLDEDQMTLETDAHESPNYQQISKALNGLYAMLERDETMAAEEVLGHVAEAKAIWEGDEGSFAEGAMNEAVSRKHFQQVADLLQNIPDPEKRKELAMHHASIFKQQNPRFDIQRFAQACGVDLSECAMWEELKGGQKKLDVDGDGDIGADDLADLRAGKTNKGGDDEWRDPMSNPTDVDEGFADMDRWLAQREKEKGTGKFDKRKVSTGTVYTRKFSDEPEDDDTDAPVSKGGKGRGRPAGTKKAIGARGPSGKSKLMTKEESTEKEDTKAEKAGKKVAKDIEHDEGNKSKGDNKAEKAGKKVTKDIEFDDKKDKKEKKADKKEEKVEETTTSGSVATVAAGGKASSSVGKGIYDSWNRKYEELLAESVSIKQECSMAEHAEDGDAETMTITATGDDVARLRDVLAQLGVVQSGPTEEPYANSEECGTCGGVPCQCDELNADMGLPGVIELEIDEADMEEGNEFSGELAKAKAQHKDEFEVDGETYQVKEADAPVSANSPDYPSNQETSDDALQYAGGLNKPKATGQTTIPVVASQLSRQMSESNETDSFLNLYKAFKTK